MKGIILAGGYGTRLYPSTKSISKQLLPIYDKPLIYYPLSVLMLADIRKILIITTPEDKNRFQNLLGDGSQLGLQLQYLEQAKPEGLAHAFILGKDFIEDDEVCLVLGDNIFYGNKLVEMLNYGLKNTKEKNKAFVFGYYVNDPTRYGVIEFDIEGNAISLEEKPKIAKSNYAVTGLYFYPNNVIKKVLELKPSSRGELEITSLNKIYMEEGSLKVKILGRGFTWLDTGTPEALFEASKFVEIIEKRQGLKIACLEEIAYTKGYISKFQFLELIKSLGINEYVNYLSKVVEKV